MTIAELASTLINEINNKVAIVEALDRREATISTIEQGLLTKSKAIVSQQSEISAEKVKLAHERDYITRSLEKVQQNELVEQRIEGKRALLSQETKELNEEHALLDQKRALLVEKTKHYDDLVAREQKVQERQEMLRKEEENLIKLKEQLSLKEDAIIREAARLQKIANGYQLRSKI